MQGAILTVITELWTVQGDRQSFMINHMSWKLCKVQN